MQKELIVLTPYYSATLYNGQAVGITLQSDTTDGDPTKKIKDTLPVRDANGNINQFEIADETTQSHWKRTLGGILARKVVKDDLVRQGDRWRGNFDAATIAEFPKDYQLYIHKSQKEYDPRKDAYLFGSRYVNVFRSPAEFAHHLIWLVNGSPLTCDGKPDCDCVYCNPSRTQEEISFELGLRRKVPHPSENNGKGKDDAGKSRARRKRSPSPPIRFKDYTKLNVQPS